jgi:hypothetical protein
MVDFVETKANNQWGPFPEELAALVGSLKLTTHPKWTFSLNDVVRDHAGSHGDAAGGLTFIVHVIGQNAYHIEQTDYPVNHYFPVPAATYNKASWQRWLLDCLLKVGLHETCEGFVLETHGDFVKRDGSHSDVYVERPFAPTHGPGDDPYIVHEYASDTQRRTRFTGEVQ